MSLRSPDRVMELARQVYGKDEWRPMADGTTFCNYAADFMCTNLGCNDLRDASGGVLLADDIYRKVSGSSDWRFVTIGGTWVLANQGSLVLAVADSAMISVYEPGTHHGHVCVLIPGWAVYSGTWKCQVPMCVNVGKDVFIGKGVNFAFKECPEFYVWRPSLSVSDAGNLAESTESTTESSNA